MDWICTNTPKDVMSKLYQCIMKDLCAAACCSESSVNVSITFEMGSKGNHPHLNLYVQWDDGYGLNADAFKRILSRNIEGKSRDILILEADLNNIDKLRAYIEKEDRERIGTWYDDVVVNSFTNDGKKLDLGITLSPSKRDHVPTTKHLKNILLPKILNGTLTTDIQIRDFFFSMGPHYYIPYTSCSSSISDFTRMTLDCKISKQRQKETDNISPQTAMVWFEFISSQVAYFAILSYFSRYMLPRRNKDGRRQLVLKGRPDVGKSWCISFLFHKYYARVLDIGDKGVGNWSPVLSAPVVVVDDPNTKWTTCRTQLMNLLGGTPFSVKLYATQYQCDVPVHTVILCNNLPTDLEPALQSRLSISSIQEVEGLEICTYSKKTVFYYCQLLAPYIAKKQIPCICITWNSEPCNVRDYGSPFVLCSKPYSSNSINTSINTSSNSEPSSIDF